MTDTELRIISRGVDRGSGANDGTPMPLMRQGSGGRIDASDYPTARARVNVTDDSGTVGRLSASEFAVSERTPEGWTPRELTDCTLVGGALDLVVVFDDTGSMSGEIADAKAGVQEVTDAIGDRDIDARYALVTFKDDVELDLSFTRSPDELKQAVDQLEASGGGDLPENNVDAIERGLSLPRRDDAELVVLDVTDAPTHYEGDGSGYASHTVSDVADDLQAADATFIAVSPDREDRDGSIKRLAGDVGGFWTDIDAAEFSTVLDRITELLVSTYELAFDTCTPPGRERTVRIELDSPTYGAASDEAALSVPDRFELPESCEEEVRSFIAAGEDDLTEYVAMDDDDGDVPVERLEPELAVTTTKDFVDTGEPVMVNVWDEHGDAVEGAVVEAGDERAETGRRGVCRLRFDTPGERTVAATLPDDPDYNRAETDVTVE